MVPPFHISVPIEGLGKSNFSLLYYPSEYTNETMSTESHIISYFRAETFSYT